MENKNSYHQGLQSGAKDMSKNEKPTIIRVTGFDQTDNFDHIRKTFMKNRNCVVMKNTINHGDVFKGIVFISFKKKKDAEKLLMEEVLYKGKKLCCLISNGYNDSIQEGLNTLRTPRVVFVKWIPKNYTKQKVLKAFETFGEIEDLILHNLPTRKDYTATVKFRH